MELVDYRFMIEFIDAMAKRGALEGNELYDVGLLRHKVQKMIDGLNDGIERKAEEPNLGGEVQTTDDQ